MVSAADMSKLLGTLRLFLTFGVEKPSTKKTAVAAKAIVTAFVRNKRNAPPASSKRPIAIPTPIEHTGAIEFNRTLDEYGCANGVIIAEAQTFIYASRSDGLAQARIFRIKDAVPLSALPAIDTPMVLGKLASAYPQFIDGGDVLQTGLNNIGAIFHPTISIFNAGWIEATKGEFQFYLDGVTPTVARLMEVLDRERATVAAAVGVRAITARKWLKIAYNAEG
jgi:opine dehydrogenase